MRRAAAVRAYGRVGESGAAAVEFALVLPLVVMLLFGMISTGLVYNDKLSIANAAREGARIGSALDYSASPSNWITSVQQRVQQVYYNSAGTLATAQICVQLRQWNGTAWTTVANTASSNVSGPGCGPAPSDPVTTTLNVCSVQVWVQKPATIQLMMLPDLSFHINAQAVSFYGRSVTGGCQAP